MNRESALKLYKLLTKYKCLVTDDADCMEHAPLIEGLSTLKNYGKGKIDSFSVQISWIPLIGWEGDYRFNQCMSYTLNKEGSLTLREADGSSMVMQLWQKASFENIYDSTTQDT